MFTLSMTLLKQQFLGRNGTLLQIRITYRCNGFIINKKSKSFGDLNIPSDFLSKRSVVLTQITHLIGKGDKTFFWLDPWLPGGRLIDRFGKLAAYDVSYGEHFKVNDGVWNLPTATTNELMILSISSNHLLPP